MRRCLDMVMLVMLVKVMMMVVMMMMTLVWSPEQYPLGLSVRKCLCPKEDSCQCHLIQKKL